MEPLRRRDPCGAPSQATAFKNAVIAFEPALAHHTHSFRIYVDFNASEEAHWKAFLFNTKEAPLRFAAQFPPVTEPCAGDVLVAPETGFLKN